MACSGASSEACGGPNRLSVYERSGPPPAQSSAPVIIDNGTNFVWFGRGCYSDSTGARILSQGVTPQGGGQNNSAQSCTDECGRRNFTYAGTEYGAECKHPYPYPCHFGLTNTALRLLRQHATEQSSSQERRLYHEM